MKARKTAHRRESVHRKLLPPADLRQMVDDLKNRLERQEQDAAALPALVETHGAGEMPVSIYHLYRALGLALAAHAKGMRDLLFFADLIAARANGRAARGE